MESAVKTLQAQHKELLQDPPPGVNAGPADDDWFDWTAYLQVGADAAASAAAQPRRPRRGPACSGCIARRTCLVADVPPHPPPAGP